MKRRGSAVTYFQTPKNLVQPADGKTRVVLVDDSAVVRTIVSKWLSEDQDISLVGIYTDGQKLVDALPTILADVIILDIEMPRMDGLTALPYVLTALPDVDVIIASSLSRRGAEITMRALEKGAKDYIAKPAVGHDSDVRQHFQKDLVNKIKSLHSARIAKANLKPSAASNLPSRPSRPASDNEQIGSTSASSKPTHRSVKGQLKSPEDKISTFDNKTTSFTKSISGSQSKAPLAASEPVVKKLNSPTKTKARRFEASSPHLIVIGSSTGGPGALANLFENIGSIIDDVPIMIAQHMPPMFTQIMAEHLGRICNRPCIEPANDTILKPGSVYVAPGGKHMGLKRENGSILIDVNEKPPIAHCRPSVDYLFSNAATIFGRNTLGIVLTGMGTDGAKGSLEIQNAGGSVIVQDEASSVVWGMPQAVAAVGACSEILSIEEIATYLNETVKVSRHEPRAHRISV